MQYLLVENKEIIHLGPLFWRHRFIQSELDDLEIEYAVSPVEPNAYLKITDSLEIFPIESITQPSYDSTYEQLVGPLWTFTDVAIGAYTVTSRELNVVKSVLKGFAAAERYKKEVAGVSVTIQGQEVVVDTSRDGRNIFVQKYQLMADTDIVQWKFPTIWLTLSKTDLGLAVTAGATYVEAQFVWEQRIANQIEAAVTVDELKAVVIVEPVAPLGV
jgi:hypothetical protein